MYELHKLYMSKLTPVSDQLLNTVTMHKIPAYLSLHMSKFTYTCMQIQICVKIMNTLMLLKAFSSSTKILTIFTDVFLKDAITTGINRVQNVSKCLYTLMV